MQDGPVDSHLWPWAGIWDFRGRLSPCPPSRGFKSRRAWPVTSGRQGLLHATLSFALPRAPGQHLRGSHAPPRGGGHHGGLCPHRLYRAGPAVLEEGEGAQVSARAGGGRHGWGRRGFFPEKLPTPLLPRARSHRPLHPSQGREDSVFPRADSLQPAVRASSYLSSWRAGQ